MNNKQIFKLLSVFIAITLVSGCGGCWRMDKLYTGPVANIGILFGGPCPPSATTATSQPGQTTAVTDTPTASQPASAGTNSQNTASTATASPAQVNGAAPGMASSGGDPCPCAGVCEDDSIINNNGSKINVQFQMMEGNNAILVMTFLTEEMNKKQPKHLHFFKDASKMYKFGATYSLAKPMYAKLNLPPNSRIEPTDSCMIQDEKDGKTIVYIKYSHD